MPADGDHRHCKVCGRVTKPDAETCSPACATERQRRVSSARTYRIMMYVAIAVILIVFLSEFR